MQIHLPENSYTFEVLDTQFTTYCNELEATKYMNIISMINMFGSKYLDQIDLTHSKDGMFQSLEDMIHDTSITSYIRQNIYRWDRNLKIDTVINEH